ncbi:extradiol dioxygenase [Herbaspirillum sp. alder98]|uniref:extradiol dioxygenase n=1 Tax=Herbaspirillum sp. alder98 TaxID=2913096 RepID=UPI001CD8C899|nr:extradiol dioxygenase [Herbaspirillum sp. alder98]MCA1323731.1 extradiol dioxygenase [Herbaspirillum sp. alder98]
MRLDHVTIVAPDCTSLRNFFVDISGLQEGERPAFGVRGHWLYLEQRPVLHLIERPDTPGDSERSGDRPSPRIDHLALRVGNAAEWQQLLHRLRQHQMPCRVSPLGPQSELQLFVTPAPQVTVEFVMTA